MGARMPAKECSENVLVTIRLYFLPDNPGGDAGGGVWGSG